MRYEHVSRSYTGRSIIRNMKFFLFSWCFCLGVFGPGCKKDKADSPADTSLSFKVNGVYNGTFNYTALNPNPVKGSTAWLNVTSDKSTTLKATFSDAQGRIVKKENYAINAGANVITIDMLSLSKGIYFVRYYDEGKVASTLKMIKQ